MKVRKKKKRYEKIPRAYQITLEFTPEEFELLKQNQMIVKESGGSTIITCRGFADIDYFNLIAEITKRFYGGIEVDHEPKPKFKMEDNFDDYYWGEY